MSKPSVARDSAESLLHQELEVTIEKMAITGEGVARHQTAVIFVPWACPGDRLKIRIDFAKKNHYHGKILEIIQPGPSRVQPPCEYAGKCGGCTWQQISREQQLLEKESLVREVLEKFLPGMDLSLNPIVPSPKAFGYRSRIQPRLKGSELGFYGWKSHTLIPVKDCLLVEEPLRIFFREGVHLPRRDSKAEIKVELYLTQEGTGAYRVLADEVEDQLFSQVNLLQNDDLTSTVTHWSQKHKPTVIFDFYSGAGNFTFPLSAAHKSTQVVGVESNAELVRLARKRAEQQKIPAKFLEFYATSSDIFLRRFILDEKTLVVLDPPRGGTSEFVLKSFAASGLKQLIYVSCNPVSLGRDLSFLKAALAKRGKKLKIEQIQTFEMFPQTNHLETLVELSIDSH
ncbi:MAG: class I SAM-dependent RNA methyltransferase [Bdellovibrionaceae bacterium]|nr:class I SAM-dependent RNA methyltransferase [Pseudobdellovibrionaceae bacterium]